MGVYISHNTPYVCDKIYQLKPSDMTRYHHLYSLTLLTLAAVFSGGHGVHAQSYHGAYTPNTIRPSNEAVGVNAPVPKIFSSKVTSTTQAERVDALYLELQRSFYTYTKTDAVRQNALNSLLDFERFQYTRYAQEFEAPLNAAMRTLNENSVALRTDIQEAQDTYPTLLDGVSEEERAILDAEWAKTIEQFNVSTMAYFKLQHRFLNTYKNFVTFILDKNGQYYYDRGTSSVHFPNISHYKYFGKNIDALRQISFRQRTLIRDVLPATILAPDDL